MTALISAEKVSKDFILHVQGGARIPVLSNLDFAVGPGECVALVGASGSGKSTFMRMIYANYLCSKGHIWVCHGGEKIDIARADPHVILNIRRHTIGYVSQFLRVVPRVPTVKIVAEPLVAAGGSRKQALARAETLLQRLHIPEALWPLSPVTFSGGEQQRVNIARGFVFDYPILLLDEPTSNLDPENRAVALALVCEAKARGAAIIGIFHDQETREQMCTREFDITDYRAVA